MSSIHCISSISFRLLVAACIHESVSHLRRLNPKTRLPHLAQAQTADGPGGVQPRLFSKGNYDAICEQYAHGIQDMSKEQWKDLLRRTFAQSAACQPTVEASIGLSQEELPAIEWDVESDEELRRQMDDEDNAWWTD